MYKQFWGLLLTLLLSIPLMAQQSGKVRYGKISDEERQLMVVPTDSTADAYVLYHRQELSFRYSSERGVIREEKHHRRVKLIKPSSFDRADVELEFYDKSTDITSLRAMIHLPDGSREKLSGRDFIRQDVNDQWKVVKFTFPKVQAGAVIEYEYMSQSTSLLIPTPFLFQENIPVAYAEYTSLIPDFFKYISLGTHGAFTVSEHETIMSQFGPRSHQSSPTADTRTPHQWTRYVMEDVPAYDIQPYTNSPADYLPKVKLQLRSVEYTNQPVDYVLRDWFATAKELDENPNFGKYYHSSGASNSLWEAAKSEVMEGKTDRERIDRAYYFICKNLRWNKAYSFMGSDNPDNIFKNGTGNSADLNLSLLAILSAAGIKAYPMLVSLRDRGNHIEVYPIIDQFDHMMVYTLVDGKPYILDANGPTRPPGLPRISALNHRGWIARPGAPEWIALEVPAAQQTVLADIKFEESGHAEVKVQSRLSSYFAFEGRLQSAETEEWSKQPVAGEIIRVFPDAEVIEYASGDDKNPAKPLANTFTIRVPAAIKTGDYMYLQPILLRLLDEGLDDVETRIYPVDFAHPWKKQFIAKIAVPEGYAVEEMPENIKLVSEDRGMEATYAATLELDNTISIRLSVDLSRTVYPASTYPALRNMYRKIIELQEAPIVLKRAK